MNMAASRKHAIITICGDGTIRIEDFSLNGTAACGETVNRGTVSATGEMYIEFAKDCGMLVKCEGFDNGIEIR